MKKKKMSDMTPRQLRCPHCGAVAIIRPASEIYDDPRRKDELYVCKNYPACKSYVGMHAGNQNSAGNAGQRRSQKSADQGAPSLRPHLAEWDHEPGMPLIAGWRIPLA